MLIAATGDDYMKIRVILLSAFITACLIVSFSSCAGEKPKEPVVFESGKLTVSLDYEKQPGYATNQFAVWIEDMDGNYINTLYATRYTANGGYKNRPDSVFNWVGKSGLAGMDKSEADAFTGATPKTGNLSYAWNLTDKDGNTVPEGEYKYLAEGTLRWKNHVVYSGVINIGGETVSSEASPVFVYEESDGQPALSEESAENSMITAVKAVYEPPAE